MILSQSNFVIKDDKTVRNVFFNHNQKQLQLNYVRLDSPVFRGYTFQRVSCSKHTG